MAASSRSAKDSNGLLLEQNAASRDCRVHVETGEKGRPIGRQKSQATRLVVADTAACSGTRADVPSAAKHKLQYFPEGQ
jgi:hypothetical protein